MKNITNYINEGLFGFGSTKQVDIIKHICSSVQGLSYCVSTYIKKQIPDYDGVRNMSCACVYDNKIIFSSTNNFEIPENIHNYAQLRNTIYPQFLINVGDNYYNSVFDGVADKNGNIDENAKIDKDRIQKALNQISYKIQNQAFDEIIDQLNEWGKKNFKESKTDKIANIISNVGNDLLDDSKLLLEFGNSNGKINFKNGEKLFNKFVSKYNKK